MRMRPTRRTFISTMLACTVAPSLPKITLPGMQFHSVGIGGDVAEILYCGVDDDRAWEIVPAYDADQAVRLMTARIRGWIAGSARDWSPESEWEVGVTDSVGEADVIASAKAWGVSFDGAAARLMGWKCEGDRQCEHCGMYSMDGVVPTCLHCRQCKPCMESGIDYYGGSTKHGACPECYWESEDVK